MRGLVKHEKRNMLIITLAFTRSEERRVGKECRL